MLGLDRIEQETTYYENINTPQRRWDGVRYEVCDLMEYRIENGSSPQWYRDACIDNIYIFGNAVELNDVSDLNRLPNGFIAEVFFMEACRDLGIECTPTCGEEDTWGVDFKISNGFDTRFLDVTIDTSNSGFRRKNRAGTFPTLFIPWSISHSFSRSYAYRYIETGEFYSDEFISKIVSFNYKNLHNLRKDVWSDCPNSGSYMSLEGVHYLENLEGILEILKSALPR